MSYAPPMNLGRASRTSPDAGRGAAFFTGLCLVQGLYYLATGVWPLLSIDTFQAVTGPKTDHLPTGRESDHWLVMTVGVLVTVVAVTLLVAALRRARPLEVGVLAVATAAGLAAIDVVYVSRRVIDPIYLADAAAEALLIVAWAYTLTTRARATTPA
jgi:hypothetical protein